MWTTKLCTMFIFNNNSQIKNSATQSLLGAVVGVVGREAGGKGGRLLGLVGMVGEVLLVVRQTEAVDVVGERAETLAECERDVGTAQAGVTHHVVYLQVRDPGKHAGRARRPQSRRLSGR